MTKTPWQASLIEQHTAWAVAACMIVIIVSAASQPQWFEFATAAKQQTHKQAINKPIPKPSPPPVTKTVKAVPATHQKVSPKKTAATTRQHLGNSSKVSSKLASKSRVKHTTAPLKASTNKQGFYVQLGAFKEKERAQRFNNTLEKKGWNVHIMRRKSGLNAVWVGPESSHAKAEILLKSIHRKLKYQGFIVQRKSE